MTYKDSRLSDIIRNRMKKKGYSIRMLSKLTELNRQTVDGIVKGTSNPTIDNLLTVFFELGIGLTVKEDEK